MLATTGAERSFLVPQVPTMIEGGVTGYQFGQWYGMLGPAKLPRETVTTLNGALMKSLEDAEVKKRIVAEGGTSKSNTPEQFAAALDAELKHFTKVIKAAGLEQKEAAAK